MVSLISSSRVHLENLFTLGWFNAYGVAAHNTSADLFLHLGDYVGIHDVAPYQYMLKMYIGPDI